jgi:hypothetical protein
MQSIRGQKKIEETIKKQLYSEKEKFRRHIKGKENKVLFVLLQSLNYIVGNKIFVKRSGLMDNIDIPTYRLLISLKAMLDTILQKRTPTIKIVNNEEFLDIFSILRKHLKIGVLSHTLYIQKTYPVQVINVRNGEILEAQENSSEFYTAFQGWVDAASIDSEWTNWYFNRFQEKRVKVGTLLQKEFKKTYNLELDDLTSISEYLKDISADHVKKWKWTPSSTPFLYIKRKKLEKEFLKHMSQSDTQEWLKLLEYRPRRDLYKSPLIPLKFNGKKVYTLITWVFTPSNHFWGSWIIDMQLDNLKLSARGKWAAQYGIAFQNYVDEKLEESKLPIINLGSRKISLCDHPEIRLWLDKLPQKEGFEVDRLIKCGNTLFVISCKTTDFLYDRKVVRRGIFFPKKDLEQRVEKNLKDATEVQVITDCIKCCNKMRKKLDLSADKFEAVLLTSMKEPLSYPEVCVYYSKRKGIELPKVHIVTMSQLIRRVRNACAEFNL